MGKLQRATHTVAGTRKNTIFQTMNLMSFVHRKANKLTKRSNIRKFLGSKGCMFREDVIRSTFRREASLRFTSKDPT